MNHKPGMIDIQAGQGWRWVWVWCLIVGVFALTAFFLGWCIGPILDAVMYGGG